MLATYIDFNGVSHDLPKKDGKISGLIDVAKSHSATEKEAYRKQYAFVLEVLGNEVCSTLLEGSNFEDIARDNLTIAFNGIEDAYLKPVNDFNAVLEAQKLNSPAINKIIEMGKSIENINKAVANNKK